LKIEVRGVMLWVTINTARTLITNDLLEGVPMGMSLQDASALVSETVAV